MPAVPPLPMRCFRQIRKLPPRQHVVENGAYTAQREAEDQALDIESRRPRQVEQTGRAPVLGHEQGLAETEGRRREARSPHRPAISASHQP